MGNIGQPVGLSPFLPLLSSSLCIPTCLPTLPILQTYLRTYIQRRCISGMKEKKNHGWARSSDRVREAAHVYGFSAYP
ncbi:hypothetical protein GGS23DRAFT_552377 [Durotheca rogersii]|uniref:uncharacterized protein n=1 Tax=Durotheca rogersii TaxID=419775 RepID=UPI002220AB9D|nr:uncharacterized protein GGS23DRAFT_552377 [Durotheca rogersii]KAI5866843.1 hypothetical protein GGS23DRAFT_552377 [Durotheca rogersii]